MPGDTSSWRARHIVMARMWQRGIPRRVDCLRDCGALLHGDLNDLTSAPDVWQDVPDAVTEADLLEEAPRRRLGHFSL